MKNIGTLLFIGLLVFTACNDEDLLQKYPHTPTDKTFYTSVDGATQGLIAAYDILQLGEKLERVEFIGTVCSGDALCGGEPFGNDQTPLQNIAKFNVSPSDNIYVSDYWGNVYMGIYRCNLLLQYLIDKANLVDFPEETRTQLMGEATFLRGLFHFKLQIMYGGYPQIQSNFSQPLKGVPYIDHVLSASEWTQTRPELEKTWDNIEKDLQEAANLLKNRDSYGTTYRGRATKGAALAMLGKAHLYQNEFAEAYPIFNDLINSGQYELMGEDGTKYTVTRTSKEGNVDVQMSGYKYIWQPEANNCNESIFDVQHLADHTTSWPEGLEGSLITRYYGPRNVLAWSLSAPDNTNQPPDANKLVDTAIVTTNYFWGFILPTTYFIKTAYKNIGGEDAAGNILDPRFKLSVYGENDFLPFDYADPYLKATYPDSVQFDAWFNWPATGYATWKYFVDPIYNNVRTTLGDVPYNTKYFRFADLLLMGAEAAIQTGNTADALTWINRVRTRARNSGNTNYPKNLSSVTLEDVYAERRVELAFEGHQFFDLVRTGRAAEVLTQDAMAYPITTNPTTGETAPQQYGNQFVSGKNELLPIPQTEIDLNGGALTQNPGY